MSAGIVNGDLDGVGVRCRFQCAAAPTVAQGIRDEPGHDQDHSVRRVRSHGRLLQTFDRRGQRGAFCHARQRPTCGASRLETSVPFGGVLHETQCWPMPARRLPQRSRRPPAQPDVLRGGGSL
jgi:hypothetical protein